MIAISARVRTGLDSSMDPSPASTHPCVRLQRSVHRSGTFGPACISRSFQNQQNRVSYHGMRAEQDTGVRLRLPLASFCAHKRAQSKKCGGQRSASPPPRKLLCSPTSTIKKYGGRRSASPPPRKLLCSPTSIIKKSVENGVRLRLPLASFCAPHRAQPKKCGERRSPSPPPR